MESVLFTPFIEYQFMQRALAGGIALCLGAIPTGVFMTLRRMSLTGDAMAHAILPGAALAYLLTGMSLIGLSLGGLVAGLVVAVLAGWVARTTHSKEDSSLASFCLISLAVGVLVMSLKDSNVDLFHVLFGNILALDNTALWLLATISTISLALFACLFRPLVIECVDPSYLRRSGTSTIAHVGFLCLMVLNLVAGFHALGTLMAIGIMILPAAAARFWTKTIDGILVTATLFGFAGCYLGLVISFSFDVPAGPAIVLTLGAAYITSLTLGLNGSLLAQRLPKRHLTG